MKLSVVLIFAVLSGLTSAHFSCKHPCEPGYRCVLDTCVLDVQCPAWQKYGEGPPEKCSKPTDSNNKPKAPMERWFTREIFNDLFPKANIGWGPNVCSPYNYEAFVIAARYFPRFGSESPDNGYTARENNRRDLATFFSHAIQETGENAADIYLKEKNKDIAAACFYRGGFFNWFEGGPISPFIPNGSGKNPVTGKECSFAGRYCVEAKEIQHFFPCNLNSTDDKTFEGCYFGRGAIQISYNYNYGQFQDWLKRNNIDVDILANPNLVMTKTDPPLSILASMWFYMTPQPPKPAMHDIVLGNWNAGKVNKAANYSGPIFGPTSLVINNECNGEDKEDPGGAGESRRIKAFKWFTEYFGVPAGPEETLSCKYMKQKLESIRHDLSYQPDWSTTWREEPCKCAPAGYGGMIPYFDPDFYPKRFAAENTYNKQRCVESIYEAPGIYSMDPKTSKCLNHPSNITTKPVEA